MEFDRFTFLILMRAPSPPDASEEELDAIQDAHLAHLSGLHDRGLLMAAGPLTDQADETMRGFVIFSTDIETANALMAEDPSVKAGRLQPHFMTWCVPAGTVRFGDAHLPRNQAEVRD